VLGVLAIRPGEAARDDREEARVKVRADHRVLIGVRSSKLRPRCASQWSIGGRRLCVQPVTAHRRA
jgi:hypothetical protein